MKKFEDLEKLKQLEENGTITKEEFLIEKEKILNDDNYNPTSNSSSTASNKKASMAMVGFILGLCSIGAWLIPIIGYPVTIIGIIFSSIGMNSANKDKAIIGLVLSIVFLIVTLINSILGAIIGSILFAL